MLSKQFNMSEKKYTQEDLIAVAKWFNETQFSGSKGDRIKKLFVDCNYSAIVDRAVEVLKLNIPEAPTGRNISPITLKLASTVFMMDTTNADSLNEVLDLIKTNNPAYVDDLVDELEEIDVYLHDMVEEMTPVSLFEYIEFDPAEL